MVDSKPQYTFDTVILSYDAAGTFYEITHPEIPFNKVFLKKEDFRFRIALLMILKAAGAVNIISNVATTISFELPYSKTNQNTRAYVEALISKYFTATEFHYSFNMILGTAYTYAKAKESYKKNFADDLEKADGYLKQHRIDPNKKA